MDLLSVGAGILQGAQSRLDLTAGRIAQGATTGDVEAGDLIDLKLAERDAAVGARVAKAGERLFGALLDVFA